MDEVCEMCIHCENGKCNRTIDGRYYEQWCKPDIKED